MQSTLVGFKKSILFFPLSCLLFILALSCAPLLNAQILMQDNFTYTTPNIEGHAPTTGTGVWVTQYYEGSNISADGKQAQVSVANGKIGDSGKSLAKYSFTPVPNTVYTLKVTFKAKIPIGEGKDVWMGIGFSNPESDNSDDPWMLIRFPMTEGDDGSMVSIHKRSERFGEARISRADYSAPVTASIKWNTSTGEAQYYINGDLQDGCEGVTAPPAGERNIYFQGWQSGNVLKVTNVTLTAEPVKGR